MLEVVRSRDEHVVTDGALEEGFFACVDRERGRHLLTSLLPLRLFFVPEHVSQQFEFGSECVVTIYALEFTTVNVCVLLHVHPEFIIVLECSSTSGAF